MTFACYLFGEVIHMYNYEVALMTAEAYCSDY
jgi:hypothetical protein